MTEPHNKINQLVKHFRDQETAYLSPGYQESQIRQDFIDKFFTALGWDVTHDHQKNPYEQEVKIENKVNTSGSQRRADYAFFTAPNFRDVKFFVEAKKPSRNLSNPNDYYQAIRYGWNSKTPIAVLTDFEELHILDCRYKPDIKTALDRKLENFHYTDYEDEEKFKKLFYLLSRDEVANGSIEKYAGSLGKPRAKAARKGMIAEYKPVDEAFLESLDGYREQLARAFKNKNQNLEGEELTEAVQRTIDRLVFIRFLEDKSIEEPSIVAIKDKADVWKAFVGLCKRLEPKYNGLVFKPHRVIDSPDFVPPDDKLFADICDELANPTSPYDFDKIPISILGSIYERFLGKVVSTTDKRAKVIEKPEVRKAGGVYYTPEYIVRYIVNETVGKLLYEHASTPSRLESNGTPLSMTAKDSVTLSSEDGVTLSDPEFIEGESKGVIRKLKLTPKQVEDLKIIDIACGSGSFLLEVYSQLLDYHTRYYNEFPEKAKKGDTETREGKIVLSHKKRQEILVNNIYGVDIDFQATEVTQLSLYLKLMEEVTMNDAYQFSLLKERMLPDLRRNIVCGNSLIGRDILDGKLFDDETEHTLKPMNFKDVFPEIMSRGGFDVVVGNPPYGYMISDIQQKYFAEHYNHQDYQKDLYLLFLERYEQVIKEGALLGVIVSNTWLQSLTLKKIRQYLTNHFLWQRILFLPEKVFKAVVDTHVIVFRKTKSIESQSYKVFIDVQQNETINLLNTIDWKDIPKDGQPINITASRGTQKLISRIENISVQLHDICNVFNGVKPFEKGKGIPPQTERIMEEKPFVKVGKKPTKEWSPLLRGSLINRYISFWNNDSWILYGKWLAAPRDPEIFNAKEKLMVRQTGDSIIATHVEKGFIGRDNLHVILGIINSKLINYYYTFINPEKGEALAQVKKQHVEHLPIRIINFDEATDKARHDNIVKLVEQMLDAKQKLANAKTESETNRFEMLCKTLDRQIDETVYELYGLTEEEIKIVEL
jgi:type I restriction-modification system DNA methylase subunit